LRDISFRVEPGQFVAVIGANGSGKSTLAYALTGFVPHFYQGRLSGRVTVVGLETQARPLAELVTVAGLVFQNPAAQISGARFTVFEEVAFGLENLGVPRAEMRRRIEEALALTGLADLAERSPYELSGGQQQRLALASMLVMRPPVLVLDEPTAQLDPLGSREVFAALHRLKQQEGLTVVMMEHKLEWVAAFADRVLVLAEGQLVSDGPPREVLTSPLLETHHIGRTRFTGRRRRRGNGGCGPSTGPCPSPWPRRLPGAAGLFRKEDPMRLEIDDLHFTYPSGVEALRGVSLRLEPGERLAIVGQNGSGKTTLARHLNGLLRPSRGTVTVGGWRTTDHSVAQLARRVGYVFQNPDEQLCKRRVWDEVAFGAINLVFRRRRCGRRLSWPWPGWGWRRWPRFTRTIYRPRTAAGGYRLGGGDGHPNHCAG
jgi:energy-coupling factor transport system ATP-binding protein